MDILKDAFSNPIETLLEYEPWYDTGDRDKESDIEKSKVPTINIKASSEIDINDIMNKKSPE